MDLARGNLLFDIDRKDCCQNARIVANISRLLIDDAFSLSYLSAMPIRWDRHTIAYLESWFQAGTLLHGRFRDDLTKLRLKIYWLQKHPI